MFKVINADRRDDLIQQRNAYESRKAARNAKHEQEYAQFQNAQAAVIKPIKDTLESGLAKFDLLQCEVEIKMLSRGHIQACVDVNRNKQNAALTWLYYVIVDSDGNVTRETNSWSGLKATTAAELDSLRQTLNALEFLNSLDWNNLLSEAQRNAPNYNDYYTQDEPDKDASRNFRQEIGEATLEQYVGSNVLLHGSNGFSYVLVSATPKFYTVYKVSNYYVSGSAAEGYTIEQNVFDQVTNYSQKIKKDVILNELVDANSDVTEVSVI